MGVLTVLVLTAYIVNFGLTSARTLNGMENQVFIGKMKDESKTRENFQNLFDSITKNNTYKSEILHDFLKQDAVREQQAFDTMKAEWWTARNRNAHKKISFYVRSNNGENIVLKTRSAHVDGDSEKTNPPEKNATKELPTSTAHDGLAHENTTLHKKSSVNSPIPKNAYKLKVTKYAMITPKVVELTFTRSDGSPLDFIPGQFITFLLPHEGKLVRRSYSLANSPGQSELVVAIAPVEGGFATKILFDLKVGDELLSIGPVGKLILEETGNVSHLVLVATGTGVAPYRSMLPAIAKRLDENKNLKVTVLLGVRHANDLLYADDFIAFSEKHKNFHFRGCLSRAEKLDPPYQYKGYVQLAFESLHLNPSTDLIYLCGNPRMIDDSFNKLKTMGFDPRRTKPNIFKTDEDRYVDRYEDNAFHYSPWWTIQSWYEELGERKLKAFCAQTHKLAGYGEAVVSAVVLIQRRLTFENKTYEMRRVDVVTYNIEETVAPGNRRRYWHMMEGLPFWILLSFSTHFEPKSNLLPTVVPHPCMSRNIINVHLIKLWDANELSLLPTGKEVFTFSVVRLNFYKTVGATATTLISCPK